jgi:hypothetical protein
MEILSISFLVPEVKNKKMIKTRKKGEIQRINLLNKTLFKFR